MASFCRDCMSPLGNKVYVEHNTFSSWVLSPTMINRTEAPAAERTHGAPHIVGFKCSFCFKVICQCEHWSNANSSFHPHPQPILLVLYLKQWHFVLQKAEQLVNGIDYWWFLLVVCRMGVYMNTAQSGHLLMNCRSVLCVCDSKCYVNWESPI